MIRPNLNIDLVSPDSIQRIRGRGRVLTRFCNALCERVRSAVRNALPIGSDHRNWCNEIDFRSGREMAFSKYTLSVSQHEVTSRRSFGNRDPCAAKNFASYCDEAFRKADLRGLRIIERGYRHLIPERHSQLNIPDVGRRIDLVGKSCFGWMGPEYTVGRTT